MKEVADWLHRPENRDEFLVILLDVQLNLANWVKPLLRCSMVCLDCGMMQKLLPRLHRQLTQFIPPDSVFTPLDMAKLGFRHLPSANTLLRHGKRVMFMSTQYFSNIGIRSFVFYTRYIDCHYMNA